MLTKDEILEQLKLRGIHLGRNPGRVFLYYIERGLVPRSTHRDENWKGLYPDETVHLIETIKAYQKKGWKLSKIKEFLNAKNLEIVSIDEQIEEIREHEFYEAEQNKILETLQLPKDSPYHLYGVEKHSEDSKYVLAFLPELRTIRWSLVDASVRQIVKEKSMTLSEYATLVQGLAITQASKGRVTGSSDIFEHIYDCYFA